MTRVTPVHASLAKARHLAAPKFKQPRKHSPTFHPEREAGLFSEQQCDCHRSGAFKICLHSTFILIYVTFVAGYTDIHLI